MQKMEFRIENLNQLDELSAQNINIRLADMVKDLIDKPMDERPRKLTLSFEMKPRHDGNNLRGVELTIDTKISLPSDRSMIHTLITNRDQPILMFEPLSPEDANQKTFETLEQEAQEEQEQKTIRLPKKANG